MSATYNVHRDYEINQKVGFQINDFALLRLSNTVDFGKYPHIRPICLPDPGFSDYDNVRGLVTGWGNTRVDNVRSFKVAGLVIGYDSVLSNTLQKLDVK